MFSLLINVIAWVVVLGLVWWLIDKIPMPAVAKQILNGLFIVLAIAIILGAFGLLNMHLPKIVSI